LDRITKEEPDDRRQFRLQKEGSGEFSDDHADPVKGYEGRWLAGFARVGETDQIVIVETRYAAVTTLKDYLWRVVASAGVLLALGFAVVFGAVNRLATPRVNVKRA